MEGDFYDDNDDDEDKDDDKDHNKDDYDMYDDILLYNNQQDCTCNNDVTRLIALVTTMLHDNDDNDNGNDNLILLLQGW